jgi:hypothetical protein
LGRRDLFHHPGEPFSRHHGRNSRARRHRLLASRKSILHLLWENAGFRAGRDQAGKRGHPPGQGYRQSGAFQESIPFSGIHPHRTRINTAPFLSICHHATDLRSSPTNRELRLFFYVFSILTHFHGIYFHMSPHSSHHLPIETSCCASISYKLPYTAGMAPFEYTAWKLHFCIRVIRGKSIYNETTQRCTMEQEISQSFEQDLKYISEMMRRTNTVPGVQHDREVCIILSNPTRRRSLLDIILGFFS